ncbi:hypothetical protein [Secundilactobacillus kimchicus]|nr:hypothetical protein [Secundilactobacillus kimchicus]
MELKTICVFCGSNHGLDPAFITQTEALGRPGQPSAKTRLRWW